MNMIEVGHNLTLEQAQQSIEYSREIIEGIAKYLIAHGFLNKD